MDKQFENMPENEQKEIYNYTDPNSNVDQNVKEHEYSYYDSFNTNNNNQYQHSVQPELKDSPLSVGEWILTILALFIPCVGIILYLVWAFGKKGNVNRRNYCRAYLVIYGIIMAIYLLIVLVFGASFAAAL